MAAVAGRYARALVNAVLAEGAGLDPRQAVSQLRSFADLVRGSSELHNVMVSPVVSSAKKRAVADRLSGSLGLSSIVRNFLFVIVDHRRTAMLSQIADAFESALDERMGVVRAQVTSAAPLAADQVQQLQAELTRVAGKQVRCEFGVDPSLIGGVVARIGSTVYDGSVRSELHKLRERLTA